MSKKDNKPKKEEPKEETKPRTIAGKDLKPGDLVSDIGLVLKVDLSNKNEVFRGPNFQFLWLQGAYGGPVSRALKTSEIFTIFHERGTREYCEIIREIVEELNEAAIDHLEAAQQVLQFPKEVDCTGTK